MAGRRDTSERGSRRLSRIFPRVKEGTNIVGRKTVR